MKALLTLVCAVLAFVTLAQPPCGSSPAAGNTCATATPICDLNGYCGNTSASYTANYWSALSSAFCGSIENNSFLSFTASSTSISFDVWVNSTTYGYGIQILIFSTTSCGSGPVTSYTCWNPGYASAGPTTVSASGLTIGNTYYIMIDGNAGDVCSYTIGANSGIAIPVSVTPSAATICAGDNVGLTASGGDGSYTWNSSPDLSTTSGANVTATPPGAGTYTYTVTSNVGTPLCPSSGSATATITVNPCGCTVTASNSGNMCTGNNLTVDLTASNVSGATYSWTGPNGFTSNVQNPTNVPVPSAPGTYTYTVTANDGTSCSATTTVTVHPLPTPNAGTYSAVCSDNGPVALAGTPAGGTFSGTGVSGNSFDPASGSQTLTYTYTDANGCSNTATSAITVNPLPTVNGGSYASVCADNGPVALAGTPAGGTFSGTGVSGNSFDPANGSQTITYTFTDANGCSNSATSPITVNALPTLNAGNYPAVCIDNGTVALAGTPAGGTFSGTGVSGNSFDPNSGTQTITYAYTDANGCSNTSTSTITVNNLPVVNAGTYTPVCSDNGPVALAGTPAGGTFSGTGVSGNNFDPNSGTQTVTYAYTDANGCSNSANATISVNSLPNLSAGTYSPICIDNGPVALSGTPAGGVFSGTGVSGTSFNPTSGTQTVTYSYTDGNGCSNSASSTITVNNLPVVNAGNYAPVCIDNGPVALSGTPAGGTFSGTGVSGTSFDPNSGTQTLTYTFTDANGCTNTSTTAITVNPLPVVDAGTYAAICADAAPVTLTGTPVGGTFSGTGVSGTQFNPSPGNHTLTYTYTDANGCINTDQTQMQVYALPNVVAGAPFTICEAEPVSLTGSGAVSYTWTGGITNGTPFSPPAGINTYTVTGTDANGCTDTDQITVTVLPRPVAYFTADPVSSYPPLVTSLDNLSDFANTYYWNFGNGTSSNSDDPTMHVTYEDPGNYTILLEAGNGYCTDTFSVMVQVIPWPDAEFHIPNVFTPNGDNINDQFFIDLKFAKSMTVQIYSRWGNLMTELDGMDARWDGMTKDGTEADEGVYFFKYVIVDLKDQEIEGHGNVTLLR